MQNHLTAKKTSKNDETIGERPSEPTGDDWSFQGQEPNAAGTFERELALRSHHLSTNRTRCVWGVWGRPWHRTIATHLLQVVCRMRLLHQLCWWIWWELGKGRWLELRTCSGKLWKWLRVCRELIRDAKSKDVSLVALFALLSSLHYCIPLVLTWSWFNRFQVEIRDLQSFQSLTKAQPEKIIDQTGLLWHLTRIAA